MPITALADSPASLKPDLAASTTDTYIVSLAKQESRADGMRWTLTIVPLAVGRLAVTVYWEGAQGAVRSSVVLDVREPNLPPDADVADIKRPARARPALWPWLLALALGGAAWWLWKNRKAAEALAAAEGPPPDDRPADVIALEQLGALESSGLWGERRYKEFYGRLTDVLRAYLERRFGMPAMKLTTWELARQLRQAELDRKAIGLFKDLFDRADLVKFAKTTPEAGQGPLDVEAARELVRSTAAPRELAQARPGGPAAGGAP